MPESMDALLRDAAPQPRRTPDFDQVWERAQRRRRRQRLALAVAGAAATAVVAVTAALTLPDRAVNVEFADDGPSPDRGASESSWVPDGWRGVTVGGAVFAVPVDWPVYGDDGVDEYRSHICEMGQIGPAVFVAHELRRHVGQRACRLVKLGDAAGVEVATVDLATSTDKYSVWLDEPSTTTTVETDTGPQTVTEWQADERAAGGWRLRRFDDLGVFVLSKAYDQAAVVNRLVRTFRPADGSHPNEDGVRLASNEYEVIAAAATRDASLKGHVVRDSDGLAAVWQTANVSGDPPVLPPRTVGAFVIGREAQSTCRSVDDVVGVEVRRGVVVVQLDPDGAFVQPCPGPEGAHAWTAFVVAIPDRYDDPALTGAAARVAGGPRDGAPSGRVALFYLRAGADPTNPDAYVRIERRAEADGSTPEQQLTAALRELVKGPTAAEQEQHDVASVFSEVTADMVKAVSVDDGSAVVDFTDFREAIPQASTSHAGLHFMTELNNTVFAVQGVDDVRYRIDGDCEMFGQFMQAAGCHRYTDSPQRRK